MSRRQIKQFKAFSFQSDFTAPEAENASPPISEQQSEAEEERVSVPIMEIAALSAQLQADAAKTARAAIDAALLERLELSAAKLATASEHLLELATSLDLAARMGQVPPALVPVAERAAKSLVDGQGDLFAACKSLVATSKD